MEKNIVRIRWEVNDCTYFKEIVREDVIIKLRNNGENSKKLIEAIEYSEDILFYENGRNKTDCIEYWFADGSKFQQDISKKCVQVFELIFMESNSKISDEIQLCWRIKGKNYSKLMDRKIILEEFKKFVYDYPENNIVSKQIVHYIPVAKEMYVNWDSTEPVKNVYLRTVSGECKGIPVIYHHKIVWQKLSELFEITM